MSVSVAVLSLHIMRAFLKQLAMTFQMHWPEFSLPEFNSIFRYILYIRRWWFWNL